MNHQRRTRSRIEIVWALEMMYDFFEGIAGLRSGGLGMKVLITGGAGYLGTVLSGELLDAGHEVRVLDALLHGGGPVAALRGREGYELVQGDVRDASAVGAALGGVGGVVHLAAVVGDPACSAQPELARAVNLDASLALFDASLAAGIGRFVFASTCSNYGKMERTTELADEDYPLRPVSLYAETKVGVERRLLAEAGSRTAATVLRFATLYGLSPRMRFDLTVNEFTLELARGRRLTVYGEQFWRPYVHVRDAARAICKVLGAEPEAVAGQVFNVGDTRENYRKLDLVALLRARIPAAEVSFVPRTEDPRDYRVAFERIARALGFAVSLRVPDGIDEIVGAVLAGAFDDADDPRYRNVA
jgi:nucleoside-diphosphate-sugar epimerase